MKTSTLILAAGALVCIPACSDDGNSGDAGAGPGGKADDVDDLDPSEFACANGFADASRREDRGIVSSLQRLDSLNDPFARAVLKATTDGCVTSLPEIVAKLEVTEPGCTQSSAIVSETGQYQTDDGSFLDPNPGYRIVSARGCSGETSRPRWHMMFSNFGASKGRLGGAPEVIAFDEEAGVFNYYLAGNGGYEWHGNSIDAATEGGNRCGNCHNNGGLIQKELDSPWINWEHFDEISGTDEFYEKFETQTVRIDGEEKEIQLMGRKGSLDGASVENLVEQSTRIYVETGLVPTLLGEKDLAPNVKQLLEPLFCTSEINLQTGGSATGGVTFRSDFFLAREFSDSDFNGGIGALKGSGQVRLSEEQYDAAIERIGQTVKALASAGITDTKRRLTYPERSFVDGAITAQLLKVGVMDEDLISDILMVDFTRPLWSDARCELLTEADSRGAFDGMNKPEDITAKSIRAGLIAALTDSDLDGATRLVAALENPDDNIDQEKARTNYIAACNTRLTEEGDAFIDELMLVNSNTKNQAIGKEGADPRGPHNIIESPALMLATDNLNSAGAFFNEQCCLGECEGGDEPDPEPEPDPDPDPDPEPDPDPDPDPEEPNLCEDRCDDGGFDEAEMCQCDSGCSEFGDCCEGPTTMLCAQ
ncbi:MAG: hypothetical protein JKY37_33325 [Nannocystaceae bacterium]|nr:hypothetical protein [Nannocystaceae bacterium]